MTALAPPALYVVVDLDYVGDEDAWLDALREIGKASVGCPVAIQVRAPGRMTEERAVRAREAVSARVPLVLNGDAALARRLRYDGVHWPEASLPADGPDDGDLLRIAAVHSVDAARRAEAAGADVLVFGAVFPPGSKRADAAGVPALAQVAHTSSRPVLAIGGITPERVAACRGAGAAGIAVVSGVLGAPSRSGALQEYLHVIEAVGADVGAAGYGEEM